MEVAKGVELVYKEGKLVLSAEVKGIVSPMIESFKADVQSGKIDPIKGTTLDNEALVKAADIILEYVNK